MEVSEYSTNVLSINEFASVSYAYLETSTNRTTLHELESKWRSKGVVTTTDERRSGLWVFGTTNRLEAFIQSSVLGTPDEVFLAEGFSPVVKDRGKYEPSAMFRSLKTPSVAGTPSTPGNGGNNGTPTDNNLRLAQVQALKAAQNNATVVSKDFSPTSSASIPDGSEIDITTPLRIIHEHFISAVLGSIMDSMSRDGFFTTLNARTLAVVGERQLTPTTSTTTDRSREAQHGEPVTITVDVHTTSLNTLILKASSRQALNLDCIQWRMQNVARQTVPQAGQMVFLAPTGRTARFKAPCNSPKPSSANNSPQAEDYDVSGLGRGEDAWMGHFLSWFRRTGIDSRSLESSKWVLVEIATSSQYSSAADFTRPSGNQQLSITVPWPASLCFLQKQPPVKKSIPSEWSDDYDPLAFVEKWFASKDDRELTIKTRQKDRAAVEATSQTQAELQSRTAAVTISSARALRRPSASGAVYPTPPDGIQHAIGATPNFDGNMSTPGLSQPTAMVELNDAVTSALNGEDNNMDTSWESSEVKNEVAAPAMEFHDDGNNDNLFGEMDGDLFGDNNVTDADFSFFDEPDLDDDDFGSTSKVNIKSETLSTEKLAESPAQRAPHTPPNISQLDTNMTDLPPDIQGFPNELPETVLVAGPQVLDTEPEIDIFTNQIVDPPIRVISPPISPELVFKRLSTLGLEPIVTKGFGSGSFRGLQFDPTLSAFSDKYGNKGRFESPTSLKAPTSLKGLTRSSKLTLPKTGYLSKRRRRGSKGHNRSLKSQSDKDFSTPRQGGSSGSDGDSASSRGVSPVSDQDDSSNTTDEGVSRLNSVKRKRLGVVSVESAVQSPLDTASTPGQPHHDFQAFDQAKPLVYEPDPASWSLARYFEYPEPCYYLALFGDREYIAVAQTLAAQAMSTALHVPGILKFNPDERRCGDSVDIRTIADYAQKQLVEAAKLCFDSISECTMTNYVEIQDMANVGQINRLPPRPIPHPRTGVLSEPPRAMFPLPAPHLEVRRADSKLTIIPSGAPFWETLGLGPCRGPKDVSAICVCPEGPGMTQNVTTFLEHTGSAYESGHFGAHERFSDIDLQYKFSPQNPIGTSSGLQELNVRIGSLLTASTLKDRNFVIYYVYDASIPEALVHICAAFHNLFELYRASFAAAKASPSNELVLQLVPLNFMASTSCLAIPSPKEYSRLAMEVYDRCTDVKAGSSTPAIALERPLPRVIEFKLTQTPSTSLMQENSVIHVAYTQSIDDRWVTAAWTDNTGIQQFTASYCLGRRKEPLSTSMASVQAEIWDTTLGMISIRKVHWRIMIACCGIMEPSEVDAWKTLAAIDSNAQISLTLLTVDTSPSLQLLPPAISIPPSSLTSQAVFATTPVSTPSASNFSPDPMGSTPARDGAAASASTPNDSSAEPKIEPDAILVDLREQSWGAILAHRLNNSNSLLEFNPVLVSGYLIKRGGSSMSDIPVVMEVNVVHTDLHPRIHEALLREILSVYRGLGTLARVRGCVESARDTRPWHVAAAMKAAELLYMLM